MKEAISHPKGSARTPHRTQAHRLRFILPVVSAWKLYPIAGMILGATAERTTF